MLHIGKKLGRDTHLEMKEVLGEEEHIGHIYTHTHTHTYIGYYSVIKKNSFLTFVITWMGLTDIMLNKVSQREKTK